VERATHVIAFPDPADGLRAAAAAVLRNPAVLGFTDITAALLLDIAVGEMPLPPDTAADLVARARRSVGLEVAR
jgi:hypothetical protein